MLVNYPTEAYNSFVSVEDADEYFSDRLNAEAWDAFDESKKEKLLIGASGSSHHTSMKTAFHLSICKWHRWSKHFTNTGLAPTLILIRSPP
jgi:viroplasmin and RNaseH domain-containing protein